MRSGWVLVLLLGTGLAAPAAAQEAFQVSHPVAGCTDPQSALSLSTGMASGAPGGVAGVRQRGGCFTLSPSTRLEVIERNGSLALVRRVPPRIGVPPVYVPAGAVRRATPPKPTASAKEGPGTGGTVRAADAGSPRPTAAAPAVVASSAKPPVMPVKPPVTPVPYAGAAAGGYPAVDGTAPVASAPMGGVSGSAAPAQAPEPPAAPTFGPADAGAAAGAGAGVPPPAPGAAPAGTATAPAVTPVPAPVPVPAPAPVPVGTGNDAAATQGGSAPMQSATPPPDAGAPAPAGTDGTAGTAENAAPNVAPNAAPDAAPNTGTAAGGMAGEGAPAATTAGSPLGGHGLLVGLIVLLLLTGFVMGALLVARRRRHFSHVEEDWPPHDDVPDAARVPPPNRVGPAVEFGRGAVPDVAGFRRRCAQALEEAGWTTHVTLDAGDGGPDVVGRRDGVMMALRCRVARHEVASEMVDEAALMGSRQKAQVVVLASNAPFSRKARDEAVRQKVHLMRESELATFIG